MNSPAVTNLDERAKLVDSEDVFHSISQSRRNVAGVVRERLRRFASFPATETILQRRRQIPVVKRGERLNPIREQLIDEPIVEVETLRIRWTITVWKHARPGDRETIRLDAERLHQLPVAFVEMVRIGRHGAGCVVNDTAGCVRKSIPDGWATTVFFNSAFDLI